MAGSKHYYKKVDATVNAIDSHGEGLTEWEVDFIASLVDDPPGWYSPRQIAQIDRIFDERMP